MTVYELVDWLEKFADPDAEVVVISHDGYHAHLETPVDIGAYVGREEPGVIVLFGDRPL